MALQNRNRLKSWFETGDYPTQQQFWDLMDSYFHLTEDQLPIDNIAGLRAILNAKADQEAIANHVASQSNPHNVTKAQVGLANVPNTVSDATDQNASDVLATSAAVYQLNSKISEQAGAIKAEMDNKLQTKASLDSTTGKIVISQLPDAVLGNVKFKGFYATVKDLISSSDTTIDGQPLPAAGAVNLGWYFLINEAGNYNGEAYKTGDWIISNGTAGWKKVSNTDAVVSVNNKIGAVVLDKTDVGLGNADNTKDIDKPVSTAQQAVLNTKANNTDVVHLTGNETVAGEKTFGNFAFFNSSICLNKSDGYKNTGNGYAIYGSSAGLAIKDSALSYDSFFKFSNTGARTFNFPDKSGTIALATDVPAYEDGTWVPTLDPVNSSPDYKIWRLDKAGYARIGKMVIITLEVLLQRFQVTDALQVITFRGLPFGSASTSLRGFDNAGANPNDTTVKRYADLTSIGFIRFWDAAYNTAKKDDIVWIRHLHTYMSV
ncbi:hypothetical protein HGH92_21680 [Chitinophaga varians]|uniref:Tail fiber protein n=1 Tax=Chitinophaga varians TaxID=2202339 RepID=A0A847RY52_9BACT|nr:hypothetical protein [Chitinophaga varians]NLR66934.1 hypothetical protein [Chitinophaga varians]